MSQPRRSWMALILLLPFAGIRGPLAQSSSISPFYLQGVVVNEQTHAPVPRCHLVAELESRALEPSQITLSGESRSAESDAEGHFQLELPSAGRWHLSAAAVGYRRQSYNEHETYSSAVVVARGSPLPVLLFELQPNAVISGFVLDEAGEAVRDATVSLREARSASPDILAAGSRQQSVNTDDRGHYELTDIAAGSYRVSVQATPWYAAAAASRNRSRSSSVSDPTFDVVYPLTWYPGVLDAETAGELDLHAGQARQINFELLPLPAAHLRVPATSPNRPEQGLRPPAIERIDAGSSARSVFMPQQSGGQVDFGSLAPGLYRVTTPRADGVSTSTFMQVQAGASEVLAPANSLPVAEVSFHFDHEELALRTQITLTDVTTGMIFRSFDGGAFNLRRRRPVRSQSETSASSDRSLQVPAGRYEVTLAGDRGVYLTGLTIGGVFTPGRLLPLPAGAVNVTIAVNRGRGELIGHTLLRGKQTEGAMVMLVPVTFGQPGSIDLLRRDQSNTDGSFELHGIIPGQYILLAIDHGWDMNWRDPATLGHYLLQGVPLTIQPNASLREEIATQPR